MRVEILLFSSTYVLYMEVRPGTFPLTPLISKRKCPPCRPLLLLPVSRLSALFPPEESACKLLLPLSILSTSGCANRVCALSRKKKKNTIKNYAADKVKKL